MVDTTNDIIDAEIKKKKRFHKLVTKTMNEKKKIFYVNK